MLSEINTYTDKSSMKDQRKFFQQMFTLILWHKNKSIHHNDINTMVLIRFNDD